VLVDAATGVAADGIELGVVRDDVDVSGSGLSIDAIAELRVESVANHDAARAAHSMELSRCEGSGERISASGLKHLAAA
jgi:hypothetical protein